MLKLSKPIQHNLDSRPWGRLCGSLSGGQKHQELAPIRHDVVIPFVTEGQEIPNLRRCFATERGNRTSGDLDVVEDAVKSLLRIEGAKSSA